MSRFYAQSTEPWTPPLPAREDVRPEEQPFYDRVCERLMEINVPLSSSDGGGTYFETLLQSPIVCYAHRELGSYYRSRGDDPGSFTHGQREWVDVVLGKEVGWNFATHIGDALANGVRPEAIRAVYEGTEEILDDEERDLAEYVRAVVHGRVTGDLYEGLERRLGTRGAVEFTAFTAFLIMTARLRQAFGTVATPDEEYLAALDEFVSGEVPLPGSHERVPTTTTSFFTSSTG